MTRVVGTVRRALLGAARDVLLNAVIGSPLLPTRARWVALRAVGMPVERCGVASRVWFGSRDVRIGRGTYVGHHCLFDTWAPVTIGARCAIAMQVSFVTSSHELGGPDKRAGAMTARPVTVEDGVWIGARATVLPGVTIGTGAVVAAGAVVTEDCAPHTLYAGVPARAVRALDNAPAR
ncbi:acyltransferase [Actinotalea fermentans]|uniref:Transferase n=1 Tax=Actinotalea fermentans TaxID=43671 RepID=A0A511Z1H2_9CELL|nr:acyltransferase [Actinotalea fermentans]GEN81307.1 transferase [Actinotalea fermentans]